MTMTPATDTSLKRTYQYLRIGIGAAGILIGVAIAVDLINGGVARPSISDYYYSDARNIFVGALVAVSLGLFALSGYGPQRVLLDAAAMFAPLIGLIPAPRATWDEGAADRGVWTYLVFGTMLLVFVVVLRAVKNRQGVPFDDPTGFHLSIAIAVAWLILLAGTFLTCPELLRAAGHLAAAGLFFFLIAVIALVHWRERIPKRDPDPDPLTPQPPAPATKSQKTIYALIGFALLTDVLLLISANFWGKEFGWPVVAVLEAVALVLFSFFWFVQSWQRRGDVHPPLC